MHVVNEVKIEGTIKVRLKQDDKWKKISRKKIREILSNEVKKENDEIRKEDYIVLMQWGLGAESIHILKKEIRVAFNPELRWRQESEAKIINNRNLIKVLEKIYKEQH